MNIKKTLVTGAISAALFGSMVANVFAGAGKAPLYNAPAKFTCPTVATGTLTTNSQGNGNANVKVPAVSTATKYWVSADGGGQVLRSVAVESP